MQFIVHCIFLRFAHPPHRGPVYTGSVGMATDRRPGYVKSTPACAVCHVPGPAITKLGGM